MHFHGGGWVLGDVNTHDRLIREIAVGAHAAVVRNLRILSGSPAADGRGHLGRIARLDAPHHDAEVHADPDRAGAVRDRRLRARQQYERRLCARAVLRDRLRHGEGARSAGAADPRRRPSATRSNPT
jgi:hypothetical protein